MKRIGSLFLALFLLLALVLLSACGKNVKSGPAPKPTPEPMSAGSKNFNSDPAPKPTPEPMSAGGKNFKSGPAPEPTPEPTPIKIPVPVVYEGNGDGVILLEPFEGVYVFYITGNFFAKQFSVTGYDVDGYVSDQFVDTTAVYAGTTIDSSQRTAIIEISAYGSWTIELRSILSGRSISQGETISGSGDEVLSVLSYGSTATISGNQGAHNFVVRSYGPSENNLMVDTTDEYMGIVMIRGAPVIIEVAAVGEWTIVFN